MLRLQWQWESRPRYRANILFLALDVSPPAVFEVEFSHDQEQDPRALHMERLVRVDSFLETPSTPEVRKSRSCCQSPQRPPPPTAHASLATSTALLPTTVFDHECVRPPVPPDPRERAANPGTSLQLGVLACVCVWGGGTPAGMPLLALSLLYLIPVICSWSSVPLGKEPSPEPAMRTAQPPPLLTLDTPCPNQTSLSFWSVAAEGNTQVPVAIFSIWLAPESPSPPMPPRSSS